MIKDCVFALDNLKDFNFKQHQLFHRFLTQNNKPLKKAIATHNNQLAQLYRTIDQIHDEGASIYEIILPIAQYMAKSGESSGSGTLSTIEGAQAAKQLVDYYESLPNKNVLGACKNAINVTISMLIENIKSGECIETTAFQLLTILSNPINQAVLHTRPFLNDEKRQELIAPYLVKEPGIPLIEFTGSLVAVTLPPILTEPFYDKIIIEDDNMLLQCLIHFPPEQYASLLAATLQSDQSPDFGPLYAILDCLNEVQRQALVNALVELQELFGVRNLLGEFAEAGEVNAIEALLQGLSPAEKRDQINLKNVEGNTVLHQAATNPKVLRFLLKQYEDKDPLYFTNNGGELLLHLAVENHESLQLLLDCYPDDKARQAVANGGNINWVTPIHKAADHPKSLSMLLKLFTDDDERLDAILKVTGLQDNLLDLVSNAEALEIIFDNIPKNKRFDILFRVNFQQTSLFHKQCTDLTFLQVMLEALSRDEVERAVNNPNEFRETAFQLNAQNPECLAYLRRVTAKPVAISGNPHGFHAATSSPNASPALISDKVSSSYV